MRGAGGDHAREGQGKSHQHTLLAHHHLEWVGVRSRCACVGERERLTYMCSFQNWIGSEAVKRKRKAGILPRPKVDISGVSVCVGGSVCLYVCTPCLSPSLVVVDLPHPPAVFAAASTQEREEGQWVQCLLLQLREDQPHPHFRCVCMHVCACMCVCVCVCQFVLPRVCLCNVPVQT